MTVPTSEQPIVQGASRGGVPEPGSVIEARTAVAERRALGQISRTCARCGATWDGDIPRGSAVTLGRRVGVCSHCGSAEFSEREIRPSLMEITANGITKVPETPKSKVSATVEDLFALRSLRSSLIDVENRLMNADTHLHQLVNLNEANFECFGFLQKAVHSLTDGNIGDFELRVVNQMTALSLLGPIRSLRAEIDRTLERYEREKAAK